MKYVWLLLTTLVFVVCLSAVGGSEAMPAAFKFQKLVKAVNLTQTNCQRTGWFYINESLLLCDPNGEKFVPVGTNIMPHYAGEAMLTDEPGPVMSAATLSKLKVWKFNTVRLNLFIKGLGINPPIAKIKHYIQNLRALGLVVIIEPHDYTGKIPSDRQIEKIINWHLQILAVVKDDPYIWLNLMNEPGSDNTDTTARQWRDTHIRIIETLRKTDPHRMLLVDAPNFGLDDPDTPGFTQSAILKYGKAILKNDQHLLFSLHTWWGWNYQAEAKIRAYVSQLKAAHLPLIFGEFGNKVNDQVPGMYAARATVKIAREKGIGSIVWEWFGDATNYLVKMPQKRGYLINSRTKPTNLTELGQLVWAHTHST